MICNKGFMHSRPIQLIPTSDTSASSSLFASDLEISPQTKFYLNRDLYNPYTYVMAHALNDQCLHILSNLIDTNMWEKVRYGVNKIFYNTTQISTQLQLEYKIPANTDRLMGLNWERFVSDTKATLTFEPKAIKQPIYHLYYDEEGIAKILDRGNNPSIHYEMDAHFSNPNMQDTGYLPKFDVAKDPGVDLFHLCNALTHYDVGVYNEPILFVRYVKLMIASYMGLDMEYLDKSNIRRGNSVYTMSINCLSLVKKRS
jgi:hypothetical protein